MSAPELGYVVVSFWQAKSSSGAGTYEYEHFTDSRDAFEIYDEYAREEYARARPVGVFEARNGLPTGRLLHPAIAMRPSANEMAARLEQVAAAGLATE